MTDPISSDIPDPWQLLHTELNAWATIGKQATLWWRDDDAVAAGPKLTRLVELTGNAGLLLAVIPANVSASLATFLATFPHVEIAQHGYAHINHAPRGQGLGAWELGMHRGEAPVLADLAAGRKQLETLFSDSFLPVIVPPWNRIAPELYLPINKIGYRGVSAFGMRSDVKTPEGLIIANAHCDPIRWKSGASFAGEHKSIMQLVTHLEARRCGQANIQEHTGYLTHHIDLDCAGWEFSANLANMIDSHPGAQWVSPSTVFGYPS